MGGHRRGLIARRHLRPADALPVRPLGRVRAFQHVHPTAQADLVRDARHGDLRRRLHRHDVEQQRAIGDAGQVDDEFADLRRAGRNRRHRDLPPSAISRYCGHQRDVAHVWRQARNWMRTVPVVQRISLSSRS